MLEAKFGHGPLFCYYFSVHKQITFTRRQHTKHSINHEIAQQSLLHDQPPLS